MYLDSFINYATVTSRMPEIDDQTVMIINFLNSGRVYDVSYMYDNGHAYLMHSCCDCCGIILLTYALYGCQFSAGSELVLVLKEHSRRVYDRCPICH